MIAAEGVRRCGDGGLAGVRRRALGQWLSVVNYAAASCAFSTSVLSSTRCTSAEGCRCPRITGAWPASLAEAERSYGGGLLSVQFMGRGGMGSGRFTLVLRSSSWNKKLTRMDGGGSSLWGHGQSSGDGSFFSNSGGVAARQWLGLSSKLLWVVTHRIDEEAWAGVT